VANGTGDAMKTDWNIKQIAHTTLVAAVVALSVLLLWRLLPALAWAGVLAIATWPLRQWLAGHGLGKTTIAFLLTFALAVVLVVPLIRIGIEAARDSTDMAAWVMGVYDKGFPEPPNWLHNLPLVGDKAMTWWHGHLTGKGPTTFFASLGINVTAVASHINASGMLSVTRLVGTEVVGRLTILVFSLVTLFFLYRDGQVLTHQAQAITEPLFGPTGGHLGKTAVDAVRGAVNGLVLVGLAEGVILGLAYWWSGLPYAAPLGLVTAVFSILPVGSPVVFVACALVLYIQGRTAAAIVLVVFGSVVVGLADQVLRPILIGRSASLPFLGVLLGIVGGLETFGLVGLFLGPAIMAVLITMWRESANLA
jgi:predicted PurR-regulated permease PerM